MNRKAYKYDLKKKNCEHLAFKCVTGFEYSTQIKESLIGWIGSTIFRWSAIDKL
jgi:hypothetical protein